MGVVADIKKEAKVLKDNRPMASLRSSTIAWFLVKRHADNITCAALALAFGLIIGSRL